MTQETETSTPNARNQYSIRVLERAIAMLAALSDDGPRSLTDLARSVKLSNATAFRILTTLEQYGYVQRVRDAGKYRLGPVCLQLGRAYEDAIGIRRLALPILEELRDTTQETVHLAILQDMGVFYLEKIPGFHKVGLMTSRIGTTVPAYCTALGKVLLADLPSNAVRAYYERLGLPPVTDKTITSLDELVAHLDHVRTVGYALDLEEREQGICCVAAPIHTADRVVAALSVSGPTYRMEKQLSGGGVIEIVCATARTISSHLTDHQIG